MPFFIGSTVLMADGSRKNVENVVPGDYVKDFQGNPKLVEGVRIQNAFMNTPKREQWLINEKYLVTDITLFVSPDYHFYITGTKPFGYSAPDEPRTLQKSHSPYIDSNYIIRKLWIWFDDSYTDIFHEMLVGINILKEGNQTEEITSIRLLTESEYNPSLNKIYSFSIKGGTMWVDGYLTTGRLNEDFDYKTMTPIEGAVTITSNSENISQFNRVINIDYSTNKDSIWDSENDCWIHAWQRQ